MTISDLPGVEIEHARRVADAVYGTILVIAVVAALSEDPESGSGEILGAVAATSIVFWLAHVYAEVLSRRAVGDRSRFWPLLWHAARQEWPLVEAAMAPAIPLLLGALGWLDRSAAITLSIVIGIADLAGWGYIGGRAMQQSRFRSLLNAGVAILVGTIMVLLKGLVH